MKNLYEFLATKHNEYGKRTDIDLDEFIERFMNANFRTDSIHECFINENEYLGYMTLAYEVDHENRRIDILIGLHDD